MKLNLRILIFLILLLGVHKAHGSNWSFIVISDIHIYASGAIPSKFKTMVNYIVNKRPDIVFITGDHTSGNIGDPYSLDHINMWYDQLDKALDPIYKAGIIVIPTVGNHDFYQEYNQIAYKKWALRTLKKYKNTLNLDLSNPLYFNFHYKAQDFFIMKFWTFRFNKEQKEWFESKTIIKPESYRFAFGHVPLKSIRGRTTQSFYKSVLESFTKGNVEIYFSGHEHMHWDEFLPSANSSRELRQLTVGTTSGTYNHPIRSQVRDVYCEGNQICQSPATNRRFLIESRNGKDGYQVNRQNFVEVIFKDSLTYEIKSYSIDSSLNLIDFYID